MNDRVLRDVGHPSLVDNVGEEIVTATVLRSSNISLTSAKESRYKGDKSKGFCNLADSVGVKGSVLLEAHFHHEAVIGEVGGVVTGLPDVHLHRLLPGAVVLKPSRAGEGRQTQGAALVPGNALVM